MPRQLVEKPHLPGRQGKLISVFAYFVHESAQQYSPFQISFTSILFFPFNVKYGPKRQLDLPMFIIAF